MYINTFIWLHDVKKAPTVYNKESIQLFHPFLPDIIIKIFCNEKDSDSNMAKQV